MILQSIKTDRSFFFFIPYHNKWILWKIGTTNISISSGEKNKMNWLFHLIQRKQQQNSSELYYFSNFIVNIFSYFLRKWYNLLIMIYSVNNFFFFKKRQVPYLWTLRRLCVYFLQNIKKKHYKMKMNLFLFV